MSFCVKMPSEHMSSTSLSSMDARGNCHYRAIAKMTLSARDERGQSLSLPDAEVRKHEVSCLLGALGVGVVSSKVQPKTRAGTQVRKVLENNRKVFGADFRPLVSTRCRNIYFVLSLDTPATSHAAAIAILKKKVESLSDSALLPAPTFTPTELKECTSTATTISTTETVDSLTDELEGCAPLASLASLALVPTKCDDSHRTTSAFPSPPTVMADLFSQPPDRTSISAPPASPIGRPPPSIPCILPGIRCFHPNTETPNCLVPWSSCP